MFSFKSNNIVNKVMLWLKIILRWIFGSLMVWFVLLFREKKIFGKNILKIGNTLATN